MRKRLIQKAETFSDNAWRKDSDKTLSWIYACGPFQTVSPAMKTARQSNVDSVKRGMAGSVESIERRQGLYSGYSRKHCSSVQVHQVPRREAMHIRLYGKNINGKETFQWKITSYARAVTAGKRQITRSCISQHSINTRICMYFCTCAFSGLHISSSYLLFAVHRLI
jgi:hypothetical protein